MDPDLARNMDLNQPKKEEGKLIVTELNISAYDPKLEDIPDIDETSESVNLNNEYASLASLNPAKNLYVGHSPTHIANKFIVTEDTTDIDRNSSDCTMSTDHECTGSRNKLNFDDGGTSDSSAIEDQLLKNKTRRSKFKPNKQKLLNTDTSTSESKQKVKSKFNPGSIDYIREQLSGAIFSGWVEERCWVDGIKSYRDIIEINECEHELNNKLRLVISGVPGVSNGKKWINITGNIKN